jgi:hypothetical protein
MGGGRGAFRNAPRDAAARVVAARSLVARVVVVVAVAVGSGPFILGGGVGWAVVLQLGLVVVAAGGDGAGGAGVGGRGAGGEGVGGTVAFLQRAAVQHRAAPTWWRVDCRRHRGLVMHFALQVSTQMHPTCWSTAPTLMQLRA